MKKNASSICFSGSVYLFFSVTGSPQAQLVETGYKVQQDRRLWHDNIDKEQKSVFYTLDGKKG